jgi:hypothetical protein
MLSHLTSQWEEATPMTNAKPPQNGFNHTADPRNLFFNDIEDDTEAQAWVDKLAPQYYLGAEPCIKANDWKQAPITLIRATQEKAIPMDRLDMIWQWFDPVWVDGGHSMYVSRPGEVASVIVDAVSKT